jgi:hypothetical protein
MPEAPELKPKIPEVGEQLILTGIHPTTSQVERETMFVLRVPWRSGRQSTQSTEVTPVQLRLFDVVPARRRHTQRRVKRLAIGEQPPGRRPKLRNQTRE